MSFVNVRAYYRNKKKTKLWMRGWCYAPQKAYLLESCFIWQSFSVDIWVRMWTRHWSSVSSLMLQKRVEYPSTVVWLVKTEITEETVEITLAGWKATTKKQTMQKIFNTRGKHDFIEYSALAVFLVFLKWRHWRPRALLGSTTPLPWCDHKDNYSTVEKLIMRVNHH